MYRRIKFETFIIFLMLSSQVRPKPVNEGIVFRDEEETQKEGLLPLSEDGARLVVDRNEIVEKKLEQGTFFQGDIVLLHEQSEYLQSNDSGNVPSRTGVLSEYYRWPKNRKTGKVMVPYVISPDAKYTKYEKSLLRFAMNDLEKYTCVQFRERTNEEDYINVFSGSGCHSHLGKIGGEQELSLKKNGCFSRGTIIHEFIHALGYDHMHSHADRDNYVEIKFENIQKDTFSNFDKVDPRVFGNFNTTYDLYSVMHYDKTAFSKNGKDTIVPRNPKYKSVIGQRIGLSVGDAQRINNMYNCDK